MDCLGRLRRPSQRHWNRRPLVHRCTLHAIVIHRAFPSKKKRLSIHLDPIEKKPFFHVLPATTSLSIATAGCNFDCKFCQTWEISQAFPEDVYSYDIPPEIVVQKAREMGARSIAHTYVEPIIFYEYMRDIGACAREAGLLNVIHSNGFINPAPLRELCRVVDAANNELNLTFWNTRTKMRKTGLG